MLRLSVRAFFGINSAISTQTQRLPLSVVNFALSSGAGRAGSRVSATEFGTLMVDPSLTSRYQQLFFDNTASAKTCLEHLLSWILGY